MKFQVVIEYDSEACASAGDTEDEARRNILEAIALYASDPSGAFTISQ